jgi:hypothetical protein
MDYLYVMCSAAPFLLLVLRLARAAFEDFVWLWGFGFAFGGASVANRQHG